MPYKAVLVADPTQPKPAGALRLLCLSDTHSYHGSIPSDKLYPADLVIHGGDFSLLGNPVDVDSFKQWVHSFPTPAVVVAGNCDLTFDLTNLDHFKPRIDAHCHPAVPVETIKPNFLADLQNIVYLEDSEATVLGLKIWGSPYSPEFNDWGFPIRAAEAEAKWSAIPDGVDIVIAHTPPKDVTDAVESGFHAGCPELRKAIERTNPALLICGHIHEAHGVGNIGETLVVNVSILGSDFKPKNLPTYVDLLPA
jgi:predicted phosphodiesterase